MIYKGFECSLGGEHKREQDDVFLKHPILDSLGGKMFIETSEGLRNVSYLKEIFPYYDYKSCGPFDEPEKSVAMLGFVYPDGTVEKVFSVKKYDIVEYALRNGGWVIV